MLAAAKHLDSFIQNEGNENFDPNLIEFGNQNSSEEEIWNQIEEMQELEATLNDDDNYEQLFNEVVGELSKHTTSVTTIRCGAHLLQLCVRAALKNSNLKPLLSICKYVVRKLHTQNIKYKIKGAGIQCISPHTSNDTRWDSDLEMVTFFGIVIH